MGKRTSMWLGALTLVGAAGCAAATPPPELVAARKDYARASSGPAGGLAPASVYEAKRALAEAEHAYAVNGDKPVTRDLAYIADRRALLAIAQAGTRTAQAQQAEAERQQQALAAEQQRRTESELSRSQEAILRQQQQLAGQRQQLAVQQEQMTARQRELAAERQAREAAERREQEALDNLRRLGAVRQEARGTVLTLSGSVLFAFGKSQLLPIAEDRLGQVADVLKQGNQKIVIEGHTDSVGSDAVNMRLSRARAEAVKSFLVSRGVPADRIEAVGFGKTRPIADNATPEGRANNRRVEIVLRPAGGLPQGAQPQGQEPAPPPPEQPAPPPRQSPRGGQVEEENPYK